MVQGQCIWCAREVNLKQRFKITLLEFVFIYLKQGQHCALCLKKDSGLSGAGLLHVDHDHISGEVRGLLCQDCNVGLGYANDSQDTLKVGIKYLKRKLDYRKTVKDPKGFKGFSRENYPPWQPYKD